MTPISFISEHTAEYVLTRRIVDVLLRSFPRVIPLYFWSGREGSSMAAASMCGRRVRVAAVYARRPKITKPGQKWVLMKINHQLFEAAAIGNQLRCPVFCGIPLVSDLADVTPDTACAWFQMMGTSSPSEDLEIRLSIESLDSTPSHHPTVRGPLPEVQLAACILEQTEIMNWEVAVDTMKETRSAGRSGFRFPFGGGYQPFFVVIPEA